MISLLPYSTRENLKYAKRNTMLLKYIAVLVFAGIFVGVYYIGVKSQINSIKTSSEEQINYTIQKDQSRINRENLAKTEEAAINNALSTAQKDLNNPSYFKLLTAFSSSLPNGVIVKKLDFSNTTMQSPIQIQILATSNEAVSGIKESFAKNSDVFPKVSVESITSESGAESNSKYTTTATLDLTINTGALK